MTANISTNRTMTVQSNKLTAADVKAFVDELLDDTTVTVTVNAGHQFEPGTTTFSAKVR